MNLNEIFCEEVGYTHLAQDTVQMRDLVNTAMKIQVI
jgi:hypothetical protein